MSQSVFIIISISTFARSPSIIMVFFLKCMPERLLIWSLMASVTYLISISLLVTLMAVLINILWGMLVSGVGVGNVRNIVYSIGLLWVVLALIRILVVTLVLGLVGVRVVMMIHVLLSVDWRRVLWVGVLMLIWVVGILLLIVSWWLLSVFPSSLVIWIRIHFFYFLVWFRGFCWSLKFWSESFFQCLREVPVYF